MGQALRKISEKEFTTRKYLENTIRKKQISIINNYNNNDDYINIIKRKSNALKEYLSKKEKVEKPMENSDRKKYIGIEEAANYTGKTTKTIRNWIGRGMPNEFVNGKYFVDIETLDNWKEKKPRKIKFTQESTDGKNNEPVDNSNTENIEPEKYSPGPPNNFVTREELNSYTLTIKDFTEALNGLRQDNQELRDRLEQMELRQKEIDIENRTSRIEKYISEMRGRQKLSWWRKLFSR